MIIQRVSSCLLCAVSLLWGFSSPASGADRPNFVWLLSEDNSKHFLKLFDKDGAETPRIAALAKEGLIFERAFSNSPVCSVARTTLITGCFAPRIGTQYHRRSKMVPLPGKLRMFPAYLREVGYYTTNNSKKDYNAIEGKGVWDESSRRASWRKREEGQPFFHMQSFGTTHEGTLHFPRSVMDGEKTQTSPEKVFVGPHHPDTPTFRYTYARYHDRIRLVDQQIGEVIDRLQQDGLLEDTFVFYFGDHGGVLPRGKGYAYETGLHVPLVVRVPKNWRHLVAQEVGSRQSTFVSFIDFGPTVLHLAGVTVPSEVDGSPFLGAGFSDEELQRRVEAIGYADRFDEKYDLVRTVRRGRFKYMRNYQPFNFDGLQNNYRYRMLAYQEWRKLHRSGDLTEIQSQFFRSRPAEALFDLDADPYETVNLAEDPNYREVTADLRLRLAVRLKSWPDLSFLPEHVLVAHAFENPSQFGQEHQTQIARLIDVADLSLVSFEEARSGIEEALQAEDPWVRYWGVIACSSHGVAARPLFPLVEQIRDEDQERLVRVRAAECLGLSGAADPRPTLLSCLTHTDSGVEANLILNSLVLLRDGEPGYEFELVPVPSLSKLEGPGAAEVMRRLEYLGLVRRKR